MRLEELMRSLADDMIMLCTECVYEEVDDYGKTWITGYCPMYDTYTETCKIGNPNSWDL